jgi:hypothetical protein
MNQEEVENDIKQLLKKLKKTSEKLKKKIEKSYSKSKSKAGQEISMTKLMIETYDLEYRHLGKTTIENSKHFHSELEYYENKIGSIIQQAREKHKKEERKGRKRANKMQSKHKITFRE